MVTEEELNPWTDLMKRYPEVTEDAIRLYRPNPLDREKVLRILEKKYPELSVRFLSELCYDLRIRVYRDIV